MLGLISIESRETEVGQWLEEFVAAGSAVGVEMRRLYGLTDSTAQANETPTIDAKFIRVGGGDQELSFDWIDSGSSVEPSNAAVEGAD